MKRSSTANYHSHDDKHYYQTPHKAKIQGATKFCDKQGIDYFKSDVFCTFNVTYYQGYEYLKSQHSSLEFDDVDARKHHISEKK